MADVTIYHNPRCSKSRQTLALLEDRGLDPTIIKYLETPPSAEAIAQLLALLGLSARQLIRTKEDIYKDLNLADETLSETELMAAMVAHPKLIERPIVIANGKAAIGRPLENILAII